MTEEWNPRALRQVFIQEAEEALASMEQAVMALEASPDSSEHLNEVFRLAHTIKGGAAMVDLPAVGDFAHRFEDALSTMRDGVVPVNQSRVTVMLQVVDALRMMLKAESRSQVTHLRAADLALIGRLVPVEVATVNDQGAEVQSAFVETSGTSGQRQRSLRVDMDKLDGMLTLSGEIAVARSRLMQALSLDGVAEAGLSVAEDLSRLLTTLHERVMEMRLVPIGPLFRQHQRTVRDVAAAQGKLIKLTIEGEAVEVDATIVERLREPLTHLVRNAVDHGIEHSSARRDAGKDLCGTIVLSARHERGEVIVEIRDDGRGMSRVSILERARALGLVHEEDQLSDAEVLALVTAPGLSTAAHVTELSGRGVGMDAVRRSIEAMRGGLEITSTEGVGTVVRLRLPLTVAIIDGFVVGVDGERYVIPVGAVTECLAASDTDRTAVRGVLSLRGRALPYVRLRHLFGGGSPRDLSGTARESIVVVQADGIEAGLVVDQLLGETQAVIKPLAGVFNHVRGLSGTTIMGDGCISLILDVGPLMELAQESAEPGAVGSRAWRQPELQ